MDYEVGKPSLTHWKKIAAARNCSLMELQPVTGRSHQLRVHLQAIGHPILGDPFYAHPQALAAAPRLLLHAAELTLNHPESRKRMHFTSAPDESLLQ
ncbi:pseudouridine synthase [Microbulbifer taiwanensis]